MSSVRQAAVAGAFYPGNPRQLEADIRGYLAEAGPAKGPAPKAIIAPHAGYVYSGPVAAKAYATIAAAGDSIKRVILLGPCHRVPVKGLAASGAEAFATPLGEVPLDRAVIDKALALPQVEIHDDAHDQEHSLEVHLPFLQVLLGDFTLVPLVVGEASPGQTAEVLELLWGGPETLIVVSTDLSHYLDYDAARRMDVVTCRAIEQLEPDKIGRDQACGGKPVAGLLALAKRRGLKVSTLDLRNSGDTAGARDQVVGYGSWALFEKPGNPGTPPDSGNKDAFAEKTRRLLARHGPTLLHLAAASIENGLASGRPLKTNPAEHPEDLRAKGACFVTLNRGGRLRGCIGSSKARRPLVQDVTENAYSAAFGDSRFAKLKGDEMDGLELSISVLSPPAPMTFSDQSDLLAQLRPGTDGLIIEDGSKRALFLPLVWESLPEKKQFLGQLKIKAGMAADHWSPGFKAWRFIADEIKAKDLDDPRSIWSRH